jgi:hypothetical protein
MYLANAHSFEVFGSHKERYGGKIKSKFGVAGQPALMLGDPAVQGPRGHTYLDGARDEPPFRAAAFQDRRNGVEALRVRPRPRCLANFDRAIHIQPARSIRDLAGVSATGIEFTSFKKTSGLVCAMSTNAFLMEPGSTKRRENTLAGVRFRLGTG